MIEVIISVAILATAALAVFATLRAASSAVHHSAMLTNAVLLAENRLTESRLCASLSYGKTNGTVAPYTWCTQITPTPCENLAAISISIQWREQNRPQRYPLTSLIHIEPQLEGQ